MNDYTNNNLYPYKGFYEMPIEEYKNYIERLKKSFPKKTIEVLKKENPRKFTAYAMGREAFKDKYWRIERNPEYKGIY